MAPVADLKFRFLLDTNVLIAVEPFDGSMESGQQPGARLLQLVSKQQHKIFVHPANVSDMEEDGNEDRRRQRLASLRKYQMLSEGKLPAELLNAADHPVEGSNTFRDLRLIGALYNNAVTHLVTEDGRLIKLARRIGLPTLTTSEAVQLLEDLEPGLVDPPPHVENVQSYTLDTSDEIFESLRADYGKEEFDRWLKKVQGESDARPCFIIRSASESYAAIALLKHEEDCDYDLDKPVLKIATLKVHGSHSGSRYGELLLKSIFQLAHHEGISTLYVEVFSKHEPLVAMLEEFGFELHDVGTSRPDEVVYTKRLRPTIPGEGQPENDSLEFHKKFGPPALSKPLSTTWVVPIEPRWHDQLFPDWPGKDTQLEIPGIPTQRAMPWGNALRKAYICNSNVGKLKPGDNILFYRSYDESAVTALGVIEVAIRTTNPDEVISLVGGRTVYSPSQIADLCDHSRGALVILFRQDRFIEPAWPLARCQREGILRGVPQTITQSREEGSEWLNRQLAE